MENLTLTEEQKAKLTALNIKYRRRGIKIGLVNSLMLLFFMFITMAVNSYLFQPANIYFAVICGIINGFVFFGLMRDDYIKTAKEATEDVKKIFEE